MTDRIDDLDFSLVEEKSNKRKAFRAKVPGLEVWILERDAAFAVRDLSASGMAVLGLDPGGKPVFSLGELFSADLVLNKRIYLPDVKAKVVRVEENGIAGMLFQDLPARLEARLDKLIVDVQKKSIELERGKARKKEG